MESPVHEKQNCHLEGEVPNTKVTFASLPIELRDKIWAATIEPRTITIHIHMRPMPVSDPHSEPTDRPWYHTFTASIGLPRPRITLPQNPPQTPLDLAVNDESPHFHLIDPDTTYKSPPAPVALHVCRESRAVALRHYEVAFSSSTLVTGETPFLKQWLDGHFGEKKIWVDFKNDTICIGTITGPHHPAERLEHTLLRLGDIRRYATADARKVRKLAIAGIWGDHDVASRTVPGGHIQEGLENLLWSFVKVEELIVYNRTEAVVGAIRKEPDQVRTELIQALKAAREKRGELAFELPEVIVEWDPYQLEQDMQLMENRIQEQARQRAVMAQRHSGMSVHD